MAKRIDIQVALEGILSLSILVKGIRIKLLIWYGYGSEETTARRMCMFTSELWLGTIYWIDSTVVYGCSGQNKIRPTFYPEVLSFRKLFIERELLKLKEPEWSVPAQKKRSFNGMQSHIPFFREVEKSFICLNRL